MCNPTTRFFSEIRSCAVAGMSRGVVGMSRGVVGLSRGVVGMPRGAVGMPREVVGMSRGVLGIPCRVLVVPRPRQRGGSPLLGRGGAVKSLPMRRKLLIPSLALTCFSLAGCRPGARHG